MDLFISGFLLSLSLCLDLGIVNTAIMKTGVERGALPALMIGLGSSVGDFTYASLSLIGISFLLQLPVVRWVLWIVGTIVLLYLTVKMIRHSRSPKLVDMQVETMRRASLRRYFLWGIGLALSSPSGILWFATVGGSVIASTSMNSSASLILFFGGFAVASNLWSVALGFICHYGGKMMGPKLVRGFSVVSAGLFLFFCDQGVSKRISDIAIALIVPLKKKEPVMKFAKYVFLTAGAYGLLITFPLYFMEQKMGIDFPPPMNHPENYYAFIGVVVVWQILFFVVASDPIRHRTMMLMCVLEKLSLVPVFFILYPQGQFPVLWIPLMSIDLALGLLFIVAYRKTKGAVQQR